jgi:hypothetical protein
MAEERAADLGATSKMSLRRQWFITKTRMHRPPSLWRYGVGDHASRCSGGEGGPGTRQGVSNTIPSTVTFAYIEKKEILVATLHSLSTGATVATQEGVFGSTLMNLPKSFPDPNYRKGHMVVRDSVE